MLKLIATFLFFTLSTASLGLSAKEMMCHKDKKSVLISESAVSAHLGHGDTLGACDEDDDDDDDDHDDDNAWEKPGYSAAVVMMRCEAITGNGVVVVSASSSIPLEGAVILPIPPVDNTDCAEALAGLLDAGFHLRSVTSGSADDDAGKTHLYTDYLLIGAIHNEEEAGEE